MRNFCPMHDPREPATIRWLMDQKRRGSGAAGLVVVVNKALVGKIAMGEARTASSWGSHPQLRQIHRRCIATSFAGIVTLWIAVAGQSRADPE